MEEDDILSKCPMCGRDVLWGNMIWLNGQCTCPRCYEIKRAELDNNGGN